MVTLSRLLAAALLAGSTAAAAQAPIDTTTVSYDVAGLHVIYRRVAANEVVSANLYLLGGSRQVTFDDAGIEPLLLAVSERGTTHYTRDELRQMLAMTGSSIVVEPDRDWTMVGLRTTQAGFRTSWRGFADRIVSPRLDLADVAFSREQMVTGIAQRRDSPDGWAEHLADSVAFVGHPYAIDPVGSERSVGSLTAEKLRAYHHDQFVKSRMLLVVVGDVARATLDSLVTATMSSLPVGNYRWTLPDTVPRRAAVVVREPRPSATNYLIGYAPGPLASDPDYDALRVACAILSGRLFAEVRSRQSLTYAVNAPFAERAVSAVGLYVSTTEPVAALNAMRDEVRAIQTSRVNAGSLGPLVQQFITEYYMDNETNAAQATMLARAQLFLGDWRKAAEFRARLEAVRPTDIQRVMERYFRDLQFVYVGDPSRFPEGAIRGF